MQYDLIGIVSSRRGIPALRHLLSELPSNFPTPLVCLVEGTEGLLLDLQACTRLKVRWIERGVALEPSTVYLTRPGTSALFLPDGTMALAPFGVESSAQGPVDNFLLTAASCHRDRLLALVLTGFDRDGMSGCGQVKSTGGTVLVLDRATAKYWGMAEPIIQAHNADRVLTIVELTEALRGSFTSNDLLGYAEIQIQLAALLETAMQFVGTPMGHITHLEQRTDTVRIVAQRGLDIDFFERFGGMPTASDTAWCKAVRLKQRIVVADVTRDPTYPASALERLPYRGELAVPLLALSPRLEARGALTMLFPQVYESRERDTADIEQLAHDAARLIVRFPSK